MSWHWCGHASEALIPAVGHLFFKIGHDDCFELAEIAGEVGEAWESDKSFKVFIIEPLVKGLISRVLDAGII